MSMPLPKTTLDDLAEGSMQGSLTGGQERDESGSNVYDRARRFLNDQLMQPAQEPPRPRPRPRPKAKGLSAEELASAANRGGGGRGSSGASAADTARFRTGSGRGLASGASAADRRLTQEERDAYNQAGFAKGGRIDGCAQRGKTRGKIV